MRKVFSTLANDFDDIYRSFLCFVFQTFFLNKHYRVVVLILMFSRALPNNVSMYNYTWCFCFVLSFFFFVVVVSFRVPCSNRTHFSVHSKELSQETPSRTEKCTDIHRV